MRFLIAILFCWSCLAATITTKTVKESGGDYTTLSAWEAGRQADIVSGDRIELASIEGSWTSADTTAVTINGWTTDATRYICITNSTSKHGGVWDSTKYILSVSAADAIMVYEDFVRIYGVQVLASPNGGASIAINFNVAGSGSVSYAAYCILRGGTGSGTYKVTGIACSDADRTLKVWNNVIANIQNSTSLSTGLDLTSGTACYAYNNTLDGCAVGIWAGATTTIAVNNIVNDTLTDSFTYVGTFSAGTDYNATDGTDSIGTGLNNHTSHTFSFVSEAGYDFHLQSSDTGAKDLGTSDPGSGLFSDDIDYVSRSGSWDIGADEYVAAATSAGQIIIIRQQ